MSADEEAGGKGPTVEDKKLADEEDSADKDTWLAD